MEVAEDRIDPAPSTAKILTIELATIRKSSRGCGSWTRWATRPEPAGGWWLVVVPSELRSWTPDRAQSREAQMKIACGLGLSEPPGQRAAGHRCPVSVATLRNNACR